MRKSPLTVNLEPEQHEGLKRLQVMLHQTASQITRSAINAAIHDPSILLPAALRYARETQSETKGDD